MRQENSEYKIIVLHSQSLYWPNFLSVHYDSFLFKNKVTLKNGDINKLERNPREILNHQNLLADFK